MRNLVNEEITDLDYCSTQDQMADIIIKPVKLEIFETLRRNRGVQVKMV